MTDDGTCPSGYAEEAFNACLCLQTQCWLVGSTRITHGFDSRCSPFQARGKVGQGTDNAWQGQALDRSNMLMKVHTVCRGLYRVRDAAQTTIWSLMVSAAICQLHSSRMLYMLHRPVMSAGPAIVFSVNSQIAQLRGWLPKWHRTTCP